MLAQNTNNSFEAPVNAYKCIPAANPELRQGDDCILHFILVLDIKIFKIQFLSLKCKK